MIDEQTMALMATIASTSAASGWWFARTLRAEAEKLTAKLTIHEAEDQRIFKEHGLRLQRVELSEFGFTAAGKDVVVQPIQK